MTLVTEPEREVGPRPAPRNPFARAGGAAPAVRLLSLFAAYVAAAAYSTWPLARTMARRVAFDDGDPALSAWIFGWVAHAVIRQPLGLFSANMFSPEPLALAYSENMIGLALPVAPVFWLTGNAVLAENIALLAWLAVGGVGTFLLVRRLTGSQSASFAAGLAFTIAPYRLSQIAHPHVVGAALAPLLLLLLLRLGDEAPPAARRRRALAVAGVLAAQFWVSLNGGVFALAAVAAWAIWELARHGRDARPALARAGAAIGLGLALSLPVLVPYAVLRAQNTRYYHPTEEVRFFSATPGSYLTPFADGPAVAPVKGPMSRQFQGEGSWEKTLFPGFVLAGSALAGVPFLVVRRRRRRCSPRPVRSDADEGGADRLASAVGLGAAVAAVAVVLSFGPRWGGRSDGLLLPFALVEQFFSGVARVPARFGVLVPLGLSVCLGALVAAVRPARRAAVGAAVVVMLLVELAPGAVTTVPLPPLTDAHRAVAGRPGAVLALPVGIAHPDGGVTAESITGESLHMYLSTAHFEPMVNGYGAYQTDEWFEMSLAIQDLPSAAAFADLGRRDVRTLIVQTDLVRGTPWARIEDRLESWPGVRELARGRGVVVYDIEAAARPSRPS